MLSVHQDALTGTSLTTSSTGTSTGTIKYCPWGSTRSGSVPTDQEFTGQRLDSTGLYYYGARYYDPTIGRFISPDSIVPNPANPQSLNRYTYCSNNPTSRLDPTGHYDWYDWDMALWEISQSSGGSTTSSSGATINGTTYSWVYGSNMTTTPIQTPVPTPIAPKQPVDTSSPQPSTPVVTTFRTSENWAAYNQNYIPGLPGLYVGSGWVDIEGSATWSDDQLLVSLSVYITFGGNLPDSEWAIATASYTMGNTEKQSILDKTPPGVYFLGDEKHLFVGETRSFSGLSDSSPAKLGLHLSAGDNDVSVEDLACHIVIPYSWDIDLRTGAISRNNYMY